ncbi:MAG TPA: DMT family transporter [Thermoanaerobaculia bacterium]|nr:DMT family transporter [Thermoanaerobaculia bacterium]
MPRRTAIHAATALTLFGCIPVVVRGVSANAYTIGIVRLAVATFGLFAVMLVRGEVRRIAARDLLRLAAIGALFFGHGLTLFLGIKISSASIGAIGLSTYGAHLLILGALTGDRVRASDVAAVATAIAGALLVVPSFDAAALGMILTSSSALMYASLPLLHQRWSHIDTRTRALGQFSFAFLFFLFFLPKAEWNLTTRDWAGLAFLAIAVTLIGHSLWVSVTTRLEPSATSILYYANIPVAILLSAVVLGERMTLRMMVGAALIIAASVLGLIAHVGRASARPLTG